MNVSLNSMLRNVKRLTVSQHLFRTLCKQPSSVSFPETDLRLLLDTVKDVVKVEDSKSTDPFYDSLDGALADLRTTTMDNHDADAFLKPVSRLDYPDYYDVITHPMDLQTMGKKIKSRTYKSTREFLADLDLIRSNCYTYNAAPNHPLRAAADRLRAKGAKLLKHVTDRGARHAAHALSGLDHPLTNGKVNGFVNGISAHDYSSATSASSTPAPPLPPPRPGIIPFESQEALIRTPEGMSTFSSLDRSLAESSTAALKNELLSFVDGGSSDLPEPEVEVYENGDIGEKRKLPFGDPRPRKRSRLSSPDADADADADLVGLWWRASSSSTLFSSAMPPTPYSSRPTPRSIPQPIINGAARKKKKKRPKPSGSLLSVMNESISCIRRIRHAHAKIAILTATSEDPENAANGPPLAIDSVEPPQPVDMRPWDIRVSSEGEADPDGAEDCMRWVSGKIAEHAGFNGISRSALDVLSAVGTDYLLNLGRTMRFLIDRHARTMSPEELIMHTLFESGIREPGDLERYLKDDVVRYGTRLTELERRLNGAYDEMTAGEMLDDDAMFAEEEGGETELMMGNFADMLGEDFLGLRDLGVVAEHGLRSFSIPKRLWKGKKGDPFVKSQNAEPPLPYPPPPPFVPLDSHNVSSVIKLLQPYFGDRISALVPPAQQEATQQAAARPQTPLTATGGLPIPAPYNGNDVPPPPMYGLPAPSLAAANAVTFRAPSGPPIVLGDDTPLPARVKIGPLGQIAGRPGANSSLNPAAGGTSPAKKKSKPKEAALKAPNGTASIKPAIAAADAPPPPPPIIASAEPAMNGRGSAAHSDQSATKKAAKKSSGPKNKDKGKLQPGIPPVIIASA